jgi:hypothetical protein
MEYIIMITTLLSLIALKLLEKYCKKKNHKWLYHLILAVKLIIKLLDGGLSDSTIGLIINTFKGHN